MSTNNPQIFFRLTKVDEEKRLIYARAAQEIVDKADEIMDYESSKPHFESWSKSQHEASGGKSYGNVRAMHGAQAAGLLAEPITFNDAEKAVDVCVHVVDDGDWKKTLAGVYTGLSMGGKYVGDRTVEKINGRDVKRYTASPSEISLVDRPCIPTATFFDVVKADGSIVKQEFAKIAERSDTSAKSGESKYGDVTFADPKNKKYPIDSEAHIRAAWNYINKPANSGKYSSKDAATIKSRIVSAWKDKIDSNGPPSASSEDDSKKLDRELRAAILLGKAAATPVLASLAALRTDKLEKGLYAVSQLACLMESLDCLHEGVEWEAAWEGDGSVIPEALQGCIKDLGEVLLHMAAEEVEELTSDMDDGEVEPLDDDYELAEPVQFAKWAESTCTKLQKADLAKVGATHSAATKGHLQTIHDTLTKMVGTGMCEDAAGVNDAEKLQKAEQSAATATQERDAAMVKLKEQEDLSKRSGELLDGLAKALGVEDGKPVEEILPVILKLCQERDHLTEALAKSAEHIAKLSKLPAPIVGRMRLVEKAQDGTPVPGTTEKTVAPVKKADGSVDEGLTLTKQLLSGEPMRLR